MSTVPKDDNGDQQIDLKTALKNVLSRSVMRSIRGLSVVAQIGSDRRKIIIALGTIVFVLFTILLRGN